MPLGPPHMSKTSVRVSAGSATLADQGLLTQISKAKKDGRTNAGYFDGHAVAAPSRRYVLGNAAQTSNWFYGFRGTVNPLQASPPSDNNYWKGYWE